MNTPQNIPTEDGGWDVKPPTPIPRWLKVALRVSISPHFQVIPELSKMSSQAEERQALVVKSCQQHTLKCLKLKKNAGGPQRCKVGHLLYWGKKSTVRNRNPRHTGTKAWGSDFYIP